MELECLQEAMRRAYLERDRARGLYATFTWLIEEVGELAEALLSGDRRGLEEEIADVLAWLLSVANMVGVDVAKAVRGKYARDLEDAGCLAFEGLDNAGEE